MAIKREMILFVPGHMCDARLFASQIERLKDDYEIIVADLSSGKSFADYAGGIFDRLGDNKFNLVGLSMGGMLACELMAQRPEQILRLALLSTTSEPESEHRAATRAERIARAKNVGMEKIVREELVPSYLAVKNARRQELTQILVDMATDLGIDVFERQSQAMKTRLDRREALSAYKNPSLVLCGDEDKLFSVQKHRDIAARLENSQCVVLPGQGHIATLEAPEAVNQALKHLLAQPV